MFEAVEKRNENRSKKNRKGVAALVCPIRQVSIFASLSPTLPSVSSCFALRSIRVQRAEAQTKRRPETHLTGQEPQTRRGDCRSDENGRARKFATSAEKSGQREESADGASRVGRT